MRLIGIKKKGAVVTGSLTREMFADVARIIRKVQPAYGHTEVKRSEIRPELLFRLDVTPEFSVIQVRDTGGNFGLLVSCTHHDLPMFIKIIDYETGIVQEDHQNMGRKYFDAKMSYLLEFYDWTRRVMEIAQAKKMAREVKAAVSYGCASGYFGVTKLDEQGTRKMILFYEFGNLLRKDGLVNSKEYFLVLNVKGPSHLLYPSLATDDEMILVKTEDVLYSYQYDHLASVIAPFLDMAGMERIVHSLVKGGV